MGCIYRAYPFQDVIGVVLAVKADREERLVPRGIKQAADARRGFDGLKHSPLYGKVIGWAMDAELRADLAKCLEPDAKPAL